MAVEAITNSSSKIYHNCLDVFHPTNPIRKTIEKVENFLREQEKVLLTCTFGLLTFYLAPQSFALSAVIGLLPERKFPDSKIDYLGAGAGLALTYLFSQTLLPAMTLGEGVASFSGYYFGQVARQEWISKA